MTITSRAASILLALGIVGSGCAPDSVTNIQATGYNAYLNTIATSCNPLMLGENNVSEWLQNQGTNSPQTLGLIGIGPD